MMVGVMGGSSREASSLLLSILLGVLSAVWISYGSAMGMLLGDAGRAPRSGREEKAENGLLEAWVTPSPANAGSLLLADYICFLVEAAAAGWWFRGGIWWLREMRGAYLHHSFSMIWHMGEV